MIHILFVCLGNICRSPALEACLRQDAERLHLKLEVDSCAVSGWHVGEPADSRTRSVARARGIEIHHKSRLIQPVDFQKFDLIIAVNQEVKEEILALAPKDATHKVHLAGEYSEKFPGDIPDPYYGDVSTFEEVMDIVQDVCNGLIKQIFKIIPKVD